MKTTITHAFQYCSSRTICFIALVGILAMPALAQSGKGLSLSEQPAPLEATPFTFPKFDESSSPHCYLFSSGARRRSSRP